jgi:hypothetical protein
MSAFPNKRFRVTVIEWLAHDAVIEAIDAATAEAEALRLREEDMEALRFRDSGIDGVDVEELADPGDAP